MEIVSKKKAEKPVILEVKELTTLCDYYVICHGESGPQLSAIYEEVIDWCNQEKIRIHHCEKDELSYWLLVDLGDVILHIFSESARDYYNLEYLWSEAKKVRIPPLLKGVS